MASHIAIDQDHQGKDPNIKVIRKQPPSSSDSPEPRKKYIFIKKQVNAPAFIKIGFKELEKSWKSEERKRMDDVSLSLDNMTL